MIDTNRSFAIARVRKSSKSTPPASKPPRRRSATSPSAAARSVKGGATVEPDTVRTTAKLFMHGRSQAVRLPKEFRFEGSEVRVHREGHRVILEPMTKPPFDYDAWLARMRQYDDIEFPQVTDDDLLPIDDITFD